MGSNIVDVKASGQTLRRFNAMSNQVLGERILRFNRQNQIVRLGNYSWSSIGVAALDENKNTTIERLPWLTLKTLAKLIARVKKGHVFLGLEPWHKCSKNQLQSFS